MDQWRYDALADDAIKGLSKMVVDFNRSRGLRDADDDDLLAVVIAAYLAGRESLTQARAELGKVVVS